MSFEQFEKPLVPTVEKALEVEKQEFSEKEWNELTGLQDKEYLELFLEKKVDRLGELYEKAEKVLGKEEIERRFEAYEKVKGEEEKQKLEEFFEREKSLEAKQGPKEWAKEIPAETFGTEEERKQNFEKILQEFAERRENWGLTATEFQGSLKDFKKFVKDVPLIHTTSLETAGKIFQSGGIVSASKVEKGWEEEEMLKLAEKRGELTPSEFIGRAERLEEKKWEESNTRTNDEEASLDKFVFMSNKIYPYGDAFFVIDNKVLDRSDCLVTAEDIAQTSVRLRDCFPKEQLPRGYPYWADWRKADFPQAWEECQKEYKNQVIPGKNFKELLANFGASYFLSPRDFIEYSGHDHQQEMARHYFQSRGGKERIPCFPRQWAGAEVKVKNRVDLEEIKFVGVKDQKSADLLIKNGVPPEKIRIDSNFDKESISDQGKILDNLYHEEELEKVK